MKQFSAEKQSLRDLFSKEAPEIIVSDCKRLDGACRALWERVRLLARPEAERECLLGAVVLCPSGPGRVEAVGGSAQFLASKLFLQALCEENSPENAVRDLSRALERTGGEAPERTSGLSFFRDRLRELSASDADLPARMAGAVPDRAVFLVVEAESREEALRAASALDLNASLDDAHTALSGLFTEGRLAALTETAELAFPGPFGSRAWSPLDELLARYLEARAAAEGAEVQDAPRFLEEEGTPERLEAFADFWKRVRTPVRRFPTEVLRWLLIVEQLPEAVWTRLLSAGWLARPGMSDDVFGRFLERAAAFAWLCAVMHPEPDAFLRAVRRGAPALVHGRPVVEDIDVAELRRRIFAPAFTGGPAARSILAWWAFRRGDQPLALPGTAFVLARIGGEDKVGGGDRIGNLTLLEAPIAAATEGRSFAVKRGIWLGDAQDGFAHPKTIIRELEEIAQGGDLTRAQAERRGGAVRTALFDMLQKAFFVAEAPAPVLNEKAVPTPEQKEAFRARWAAVAAKAAEAFPKTPAFGLCPPMDELLACFLYGDLAMRGELKALPPDPKAFFGADPAGYFQKDETALGTLEALADFWKRVAARDAGFSDAVKRRFFILGFAPNAVWTYLVSTWFLAGRGKDGTLERFLRAVTAFVWGYSVVRPGADALKTAVLPEFAAIVRGRPVFEGTGFLYNEIVSRLAAFDFGTNHPVRQAYLGWWAFRGENQPLPAPGTMFGVEHLGFGEALGNTSLIERSFLSTGIEAGRSYTEKRRIWLGLAGGSVKTAVRELEAFALAHEGLADADIGLRTEAIFEAFVDELGEAGIIRYWAKGQFEERWANIRVTAAEALPGAMDQLLDGFLYGELARRKAIGPSVPKPKDLYGEAGARAFFRTRKAPLETLESLSAFWKRVRLLDESFSPEARRWLSILAFAPNPAWTYLLSAWFLAGAPSRELPVRLLRAMAAFTLGWAVEHPDEASLKEALLPEFARVASERPLSFSNFRFDPETVRQSLASRRFTPEDPLTVPLLAWWTFRRADQPIFGHRTQWKLERLTSAENPGIGGLSLIEKSINADRSGESFAERRPYYLGFTSGKKIFQKTGVLELAEIAASHEDFTPEDAKARTKTIVDAFIKEIEKNGLLEEAPQKAPLPEDEEHTEEVLPEISESPQDEGAWWSAFEWALEAEFPCLKGRATDMILAQYRAFECARAGEPVGDPWDFGDFFSGRLEDGAVLSALTSLAHFWERVRTRDPGLSEQVLSRLEVLRAVPDLDWMMPLGVRFLAVRRADDSIDTEDFEKFIRTLAAFLPAFALTHPDADTLRDGTLSGTSFSDVRFSREALGDAFRAFDFARRDEVEKRLRALGDGMLDRLLNELDAVGMLDAASGRGEKTEEGLLPPSAGEAGTPSQDERAWWSAFERAFEADFPSLGGRTTGMLLAQYRVLESVRAGDPWEVDDFYGGPDAWRLEDGAVLAALSSLAHFWERVRTRDPDLSEAVLRRLEVLRAVPDLDWMMPLGIWFLALRRTDDSVDTGALERFLRALAAFLPAFAVTQPEKDTLRDGTLPETSVFLTGGPAPFTTARFSRKALEGADFDGRDDAVKRILALDPTGGDRLCAVLLDELKAVGLLEEGEEENDSWEAAEAAARRAERERKEVFERRWLALEKKGSGLLPTKELFTCAMYAELALSGEAIAIEPNYRNFYREGTPQFFFEHEDALGRLELLARFWRRAADEDTGFSESVRRRFAVLRFAPTSLWKPMASVWAAANPEAAEKDDGALDRFLRALTAYLWAAAIGHPGEALSGQVLPCLTRIAQGSSDPFHEERFDAGDIRRRLWRFAFTEDSPETAAFAAWAVFRREDQPVPRPGTALRAVQIRFDRRALRDPRTLTAIGNWTLLEPEINAATFARRFSGKEGVSPSVRTPVLKTFVRDLDRWAGTTEDFSEEDIVERTRTIVDAFVLELVDAGLSDIEPGDEQDVPETEAHELSPDAQALLGDFMLCELAREGKSIEDADEADPRAFLEENPEAAERLEALADFVGRTEPGRGAFALPVERRLRILSFAPEAARRLLLSAWFLANRAEDGQLDEAGFERFLRSAAAFLLVLALRGSDEETERSAVLGVLPGLVRGEEDAFTDSLLTHEDVRRRFAQLDFAVHESAARAFLAWWAFRDEAQPLFGPREAVRLERILPPEPDDWAAVPEGPGNFSLIEACIQTDACGPRYAEKRRFYLGVRAGKRRTQGTKLLELAQIAKTHRDFTREDTGRRSEAMLSAFLAELTELGLLPAEEISAASRQADLDETFALRWNRLVKTAAAAFPWLPASGPGSALEVVLEGYMYFAVAKSARTAAMPKPWDFYRGGVRSFLRGNPLVFTALEALADFWLRVRSRHKGFSMTVLRRLYVLNRVPDERWMIPLSVWFLSFRRADGTVPDAPLGTFLRTLTAFLCACTVVQSGDGVFGHSPFFAVLPDIAAGRPLSFEAFRFTRARVRSAMLRQRFLNISPATRLMLAWWAMRREDQPLPGRAINIEHIYAKGFTAFRPLEHRRNLEAIGNKSLLEHALNDLAGSRSFAEKRTVYLGEKGSRGTVFLELRDLAEQKEDFTEKDIVERTEAIVGTFLGELDALGLLEADMECDRAFERRWAALEQRAAEAFPPNAVWGGPCGREELLDTLTAWELAKRGEPGDRLPKFREIHGGDPALHFRRNPELLEAAEVLADFWKRVRARDARFTEPVLKRLWILDWAPNAVWVQLLSAWVLAGRPLEAGPFEGFLRRMTAFIWAFSVVQPGADALRAAVAPEIARLARGEEPLFTGADFTREGLRARLIAFDFAGRPVRDSFAAWWAASRPDQPLPPPGTELTVVRLRQRDRASGEAPGDRRTLEAPGNTALAEKRDLPVRFAEARRVWLGLDGEPKTVMRELEEIAAAHEDFTERDIVMRTARIVAAFLDEAAENGLFTEDARPAVEVLAQVEEDRPVAAVQPPVEAVDSGEVQPAMEAVPLPSPPVQKVDAFTERWEEVERLAKAAFPPIPAFGGCLPMDELLACFMHHALGLSGETDVNAAKLSGFYGSDRKSYFRGNDSAFCALEALARFWHRARSQERSFSQEVLRRFWVLGFAPNAVWTYLVSAWFLAHREGDRVENEPLGRFLRLVTAVVWSSAIVNPRKINRLKAAARRAIVEIAAGRPVTFSEMRLPPGWLRDRLGAFDFTVKPVRFAFLAWWTMQREGQALPEGSVRMVLEDLYPEARDLEEPLEDEKSLGAIGNGVLLEADVAEAIPETDWSFADLRRHWLEGPGTGFSELREIAQKHEDLTEADIRERSNDIFEAFIAELGENGLLDAALWAPGEFEEHWEALKADSEAIFPRTPAFGGNVLFDALLPWTLAVRGRLGNAAPKPRELLGDRTPEDFFRGERALFERAESLLAFWKRVLTQDRSFSEGVLRRFYILSFAPNALWTTLVSAWHLSRRDHAAPQNESLERFLRSLMAVTLGWSVLSGEAKALRDALLPDITRLAQGLPPVFDQCRFEPVNLRLGLAARPFEDEDPLTRAFLAWRAFGRADQPLMSLRSELRVERILPAGDDRLKGLGNRTLIEKSIVSGASYAEKRRRFLGFKLGKKTYQKTRIRDLEELAASHDVFTEKDAALRSAEILDAFMEELGELDLFVPAAAVHDAVVEPEAPDAPGLFAGDVSGAEAGKKEKVRRTRLRRAAPKPELDLWQMADFDRRWCAVMEAAGSAMDDLLGRFEQGEGENCFRGRDPREYFEDHEGALERLEALAGLLMKPAGRRER